MGNERLCDCGSPADWEEIGSTWICMACRDRDARKNLDELKETLGKLEQAEAALRLLKVDTLSVTELLSKLKVEIYKIEV
jgi:hypothetical protein